MDGVGDLNKKDLAEKIATKERQLEKAQQESSAMGRGKYQNLNTVELSKIYIHCLEKEIKALYQDLNTLNS